MAAFHPRLEDLPAEFAVFPLPGALLLPRGKLPLNIFEPRYLAMVLDSLAVDRMFGMIQPDPNAAAAGDETGLYHVGCLGRLSSFNETDDRRLLITLTGLASFTVST
jgi:Lon protease-like protein